MAWEMGGNALRCNRMMLWRGVGELLPTGSIGMSGATGLTILPRQGEVARSDGGADTEQRSSLTSPSVWQEPATSPWRGRIGGGHPSARPMPMLARALSDSLLTTG